MEGQVFLIVLGIALGAVLIYCLVLPAKLGARGERAVHGILKQSLHSSDYAILRDVLLRGAHGIVRIDHVVVSRFGIFVIETRDLAGWIVGSEEDGHWIQSLDDARTEFPNPLQQGREHVRVLQDLLGLPATKFHPIAVFSNKAEFWKTMPLNVIRLERLLPYIEVRNTPVLTLDEAARAAAQIESSQLDPEVVFEMPRVESLRVRNAETTPAVAASPAAAEDRAPARPALGGRRAARALAGVAALAVLVVAAKVMIGDYDQLTSIGGAWPTAGQPAGRTDSGEPQAKRTTYDPATLRCGYSLEPRRCGCFEPDGTRVPMSFEACRELADASAGR